MKTTKLVCFFACVTAPAAFASGSVGTSHVAASAVTTPHTSAVSNRPAVFPFEFRSIDGSGNNPIDGSRGAANTPLLRHTTIAYADGVGSPAAPDEPSARLISNLVVAQPALVPSPVNSSDYLWQWGQFIDHDMDLTPSIDPIERFDVKVPMGDPSFDPDNTGTQTIELDRSLYQMIDGIRQQINVNTAWIDASQVYGSDEARAQELRRLDGSGMLKSSEGNLLPYNEHGFPNLPDTSAGYFIAGDVRSNEQVCLTVMHTLFMREHNYWAAQFKARMPHLSDDDIYYRARAVVGAEIQVITFRDFLPLLLGKNAIAPYSGYHSEIDPGIENAFSTGCFRVGHTLLSPVLQRLDANGQSIGALDLSMSFFNPTEVSGPGIEPYLRGLASQVDQKVDSYIVDGLRNFLFGPPGAGGFDLASLNIQRGRDHGMPRYNEVRRNFGLVAKNSFAQISSDPVVQANLAAAYATPEDVDLWVGAISEDHYPGALVGELIYTVLKDQFTRLRDGDRFWYQTYLPPNLVRSLEKQPLSAIIERNTPIGSELQRNVFRVPGN
jgi:hypothetical protein